MACVIFRKKKKHQREHDKRDIPSSIPSVVVASPEAPNLAPDFFAGGQRSSCQREKEEEEEQAGQAESVHTKHIGHESLPF